ncbi:MAG TPA: polysaccharide biosynthesis C-terminal domain-containing protein [Salinimicrobium sp.]|nr:polysaccharide biosynthesis C-terminal domain-containing protein [Salinimicrobium sp.]
MGIVLKQSFKNVVTTYLGFGIGAINTLFLYTHFLEKEYYGLVTFLLSAANLIWPLMAFGVHNTLVKFFSSYKTKQEKDKLLNMILLMPLAISGFLGIIGFIFYESLLNYFSDDNQLVQPYVWLIFVVAVATAYFEVFFSWSKVYYQSVFGNFMKEVFHRVMTSILLICVYLKWMNVEEFIYALVGVYVLRMLIMKVYAFSLHFPKLSISFPNNKISILKYSSLILLAGSVAMVLLDLDKVMIEAYLPIENVAIFAIGIYIASVIAVPGKAMHQITYPLTAMLLNNRDFEGLKSLYKKSSINLLVVSGIIFLLIIGNLRQLYEIIPDAYQIDFSIIVLIAVVKLYDNILGNNNSILFNSDYYRLVLATGVFLAVLAFVLNLVFIPLFGIYGAALATFIAFAIYNTAKIAIVYWKFKMHPFSKKTVEILLFILIFSVGFYFWDFPFHPIINILLKSLIIGLGYLFIAFKFHFSEDISDLFSKWKR